MADEEKADGEVQDETGSKKGGGLVLTFVVALLMGGAGFALPHLMPSLVGAEQVEEKPKSPIPSPEEDQAFVPFGEVVVNLDEARLSRYLRTSITLQVDKSKKEEIEKLIEDRKAILKNWMIGFLADKDMDQIRGAAGQNRIRRQIQDHLNTVLFDDGYDRIHDVLFEEFNVQ